MKMMKNLDECEILKTQVLEPIQNTVPGWSGPKYQQNKTNKFFSVYCVMYAVAKSYNNNKKKRAKK